MMGIKWHLFLRYLMVQQVQ